MSIIMGAIFSQINTGMQSAPSEAAKVDLMQESREFMDQMARDLRSAGYPNTRNFSADQGTTAANTAFGLVKVDSTNLWFEGSIDGSGTVYVVRYQLDDTCNPLPCLKRTQTAKAAADPLAGQIAVDYETEVQNVANFDGNDATPIFIAYDASGTAVPPIDINSPTIAGINSLAVTLKVRSSYLDPKTNQYPVITLLSTVRMHNCSYGYQYVVPGAEMGC